MGRRGKEGGMVGEGEGKVCGGGGGGRMGRVLEG